MFSRALCFSWLRCITVSDTAPLSQTRTWATDGRGGGLAVGGTRGDRGTQLGGSPRPGDLGLEGERGARSEGRAPSLSEAREVIWGHVAALGSSR